MGRSRPANDERPDGAEPVRGADRSAVRREHKQMAREARERANKQAKRRAAATRLIRVTVIVAIGVAVAFFVFKADAPGKLSQEAQAAVTAAACSNVQVPEASAPGGQHLDASQVDTYTYDTEPATSGFHAPGPLPGDPHVYDAMPLETALVHNLEHGFVIVYYRADGDGALPQEVVDALAPVVETQTKAILSPHTSLPEGVALAFTSWNRLLTCPSGVTADQAVTIEQAWHAAFECKSNAPERKVGSC